MKSRIVFPLLALALLIVIFLNVKIARKKAFQQTSTTKTNQNVFADFPLNQSVKIIIKDKQSTCKISKKDQTWVLEDIDDYPADFAKVRDFLLKISDLKISQSFYMQNLDKKLLTKLKLHKPKDKNSAKKSVKKDDPFDEEAKTQFPVHAKIYDVDNKTLADIIIGAEQNALDNKMNNLNAYSSANTSRFIKTPQTPENEIWLVAGAFQELSGDSNDWLDKDFFNVENMQMLRVKYRGKKSADSYEIFKKNPNSPWQIKNPPKDKKLDKDVASSLGAAFASPSFEKVSAQNKRLGKISAEIDIETFDNFTYDIRLGQKRDDESYPLKINVEAKIKKPKASKDEKEKSAAEEKFKELSAKLAKENKLQDRIFFVNEWTVSYLLKDKKDLLTDKKEKVEKRVIER